jgi:serine/threonine protein kinase
LCAAVGTPQGACHGDIKPENFMVTSWSWVFLTDFASFKPAFLPAENNVSVFFYFFEPVKNRSRCCIAPERFVSGDAATSGGIPATVAAITAGPGGAAASGSSAPPSPSLPPSAVFQVPGVGGYLCVGLQSVCCLCA